MEFRQLVDQVCERVNGTVLEASEDRYEIRAPLTADRQQRIVLRLKEKSVRYSTRCADADARFDAPNFYRMLLEQNYQLAHGYFAISPDGGIEIVDSQLLETCDPEELFVSLTNLAAMGDFVESRLADDEEDRF